MNAGMNTGDEIEAVFNRLNRLITTGKFEKYQLEFMEQFLLVALEATRKVLAKAKGNPNDPTND